MKSYPEDWSPLTHYCHVMIPKNLRTIVKRKHLLSKAIRAFYFRDSDDIKLSRYLETSSPKQGLVKVGIRLTKCLYAMLAKQNFQPDKRSGWPMLDRKNPDFKASDLGAKLTQGFEILFKSKKTPKSHLFESYVQNLNNTGYFQDELQGSKKYNELLAKAKIHFETNNESVQDFSDDLQELLDTSDDIVQDDLEPEDDDSWLDVELNDFDDMLKSHFGVKGEPVKTHDEIPDEIKTFLKTMSDLKGVEENAKTKSENIDFNPEDLEKAFNKVLQIQDESDEELSDEDVDFDQDFEGEMKSYFGQMSEELQGSKVTEDDNDWTKPLDIDSRMLANLMESYNSQGGLPGPASTLLEDLGFDLRKEN